jgi:hypothetical protein
MFFMLCFVTIANAQEKTLFYNIKKGGNVIGQMNIKEVQSGSSISLKLESSLKPGFLLLLKQKLLKKRCMKTAFYNIQPFISKPTAANKSLRWRLFIIILFVFTRMSR